MNVDVLCVCVCVGVRVCVCVCVYVFPANLANLERLEQLEKERARQHETKLLSQVGGMAGVERVWFSPHRGSDGVEGAGESGGGVLNRERGEAERVGGRVRGAGGGDVFLGGWGVEANLSRLHIRSRALKIACWAPDIARPRHVRLPHALGCSCLPSLALHRARPYNSPTQQ